MQPGMMIGPHMGLTRAEIERFTLPNLIDAALTDNSAELAEFRKLSDGVGLITGQQTKSFGSFLFAGDQLGWLNRRDLTASVGSAGGYTVSTQVPTFSGTLAKQSLIGVLPVQRLQSMKANLTLDTETVRASGGWAIEGGVATTSESTFGQVALTPKTATATVVVSRQLKKQMGDAAAAFINNLLAEKLAEVADAALLVGTGASGQPGGITLATGVDSRAGTAYTWSDAVAMLKVCDGYAQGESVMWVAGVDSAETLRKRERAAGSCFIADDDRIANKRMLVSRGAPAGSLTVTEWAKVWFADWGALEIMVDPFTDFKTGKVRILARWLVDVGVERPQLVATATTVT